MINRKFVEQLFATSTIQRWTDHIRPLDLTALGKHAHMVTIAWVIGRRAETEYKDLWQVDWDYLIRGSLYELLRVSILTDIKSPVLDEIRKDDDNWKKVNESVLKQLSDKVPDLPEWFADDMHEYLLGHHSTPERSNAYVILRAASALATAWEFRLVEHANPFLHDLADTKASIEAGVRRYQYVPAVLDIYENRNDLGRFTDLCGRLRFQQRWSQTPIVPSRPVLDHELMVGYLTYGCIADGTVECQTREMWHRYQGFFGAVFHDLSEVLTRDIISPVKDMDDGVIGQIVKEIERDWFEKLFEPMLPKRLYNELRFFALEEFKQRTWPPTDWPMYLQNQDSNRDGVEHPGPVIHACDKFAAFMEAYYSISFGVHSSSLWGAVSWSDEAIARRRGYDPKAQVLEPLYESFQIELKEMAARVSGSI